MAKLPTNDENLAKLLKQVGHERVPVESLDKDSMQLVAEGHPSPSFHQLLCKTLWRMAIAGEQWAATLVLAYAIGRPGVQEKTDGQARSADEKLNDATKHHLNRLARSIATSINTGVSKSGRVEKTKRAEGGPGEGVSVPAKPPVPSNPTAAPARRILDLPKDRDRDT